jgi:lipopolysaccharide export system permease protein
MTLVGKYLTRKIGSATLFVLAGFLALFAFFDLINEMDDVGRAGYRLTNALVYVGLSLPSHVYEIMPIAVLIGGIYALSQFAASSEFTAMRAAGLGRTMALREIAKLGLVFVFATILVGEFLVAPAERLAQRVKHTSVDKVLALNELRSGVWLKDSLKDREGEMLSQRFVNIGLIRNDSTLEKVKIFEFDGRFRLTGTIEAKTARLGDQDFWELTDVSAVRFEEKSGLLQSELIQHASLKWKTELKQDILNVLSVQPERMSMVSLWQYIGHLEGNRQKTNRYEIALWKKLVYPFAILVMLMLALPFAYLNARAGGIGYKVFAGIMLGIAFHFLNGLFSHLGLLNTWPAWISALVPSLAALLLAFAMLFWVDRVR